MTSPAMAVMSGRVSAASQKSVIVDVYSQNLGPTTEQNEEITLQLDSSDLPIVIKTSQARQIFIAEGDHLDVAGVAHADKLAVYGFRNVTDGSVYLVRTAGVASGRMDRFIMILGIIVLGLLFGGVGVGTQDLKKCLEIYAFVVALLIVLFAMSTLSRSMFGFVPYRAIRLLTLPGGRREMRAAREALTIGSEEGREVRIL